MSDTGHHQSVPSPAPEHWTRCPQSSDHHVQRDHQPDPRDQGSLSQPYDSLLYKDDHLQSTSFNKIILIKNIGLKVLSTWNSDVSDQVVGAVLVTNLCLVTGSINYLATDSNRFQQSLSEETGPWPRRVMRNYATLPPPLLTLLTLLTFLTRYQGVIN